MQRHSTGDLVYDQPPHVILDSTIVIVHFAICPVRFGAVALVAISLYEDKRDKGSANQLIEAVGTNV